MYIFMSMKLFCINLLFLSFQLAYGQNICDGNLGENIFTEGDFGSGTELIPLNDPGIAPGYLYDTSPPVPDGSYTLTNDMGAWIGNYPTWLGIQDNSDDPLGYFAVFNASYDKGLFYEQTVDGLCENTLYEFTADVINVVRTGVNNHILPDVSFLLNDEIQYTTGGIPQDEQWNKYGFTFTTAQGQESVTLSLVNNADGGGGNDLAIDNISFRPCGPNSFIETDQTLFLCEQDNVPAKMTADVGANDFAVQWQTSLDGDTWQNIDGATSKEFFHDNFDPGIYYYRYLSASSIDILQNEKCRIFSDQLTLEVIPLRYEVTDSICTGAIYEFGNQELIVTGSYIDTFIGRNNCDSIVNLDLIVLNDPFISADVLAVDPSCFNTVDGSLAFDNIQNGYPPYEFFINGTSNGIDPFFGNLPGGNFQLEIVDRFQCNYLTQNILAEDQEFIINAGPDREINLGDIITIELTGNQNIVSAIWTPDDFLENAGETNSQEITPLDDINYTIIGFNEFDCPDTTQVNVQVDKDNIKMYLPNIFSPNKDGINESFFPMTDGIVIELIEEMVVFDRWGAVVFEAKNFQPDQSDAGWDGSVKGITVASGVFSYYVKARIIDGRPFFKSGDVTIIR